jgi:hypothetical protein
VQKSKCTTDRRVLLTCQGHCSGLADRSPCRKSCTASP